MLHSQIHKRKWGNTHNKRYGERGREGKREGKRERGKEGGRKGGKEGEREGGRDRGRERGKEEGKEGGREGGRDREREGEGERYDILVVCIILEVCLPCVLCGGATVDHAVFSTLAAGHLEVVGDASVVSKVVAQPRDTDTIMVGLSLEIGDSSNFCIM